MWNERILDIERAKWLLSGGIQLLPTNLLDMEIDLGGEQLAAPKEIVDLVERFESNLESYKSGHYN
jgi:hypothetical protein